MPEYIHFYEAAEQDHGNKTNRKEQVFFPVQQLWYEQIIADADHERQVNHFNEGYFKSHTVAGIAIGTKEIPYSKK